MGMPIDLVLVRHGESEANAADSAARRGDDSLVERCGVRERHPSLSHLTNRGVEQARQAGVWIKQNLGEKFDRYYVSRYTRALETAAHLGLLGVGWHIDPRLREQDYGREALMTSHERRQEWCLRSERLRQSSPFFWRPVGGETMAEVFERIHRMLDTLHREADRKRVLVVCHGHLMRAFHVALAGLTPQAYTELVSSRSRRRHSQRPSDPLHAAARS